MAITLNGDSGITNVNGTAAAPAITGTDTDSGMYFGTNTVALSTSGTAAVTVDSSQNVGIGTASPTANLEIYGASSPYQIVGNGTQKSFLGVDGAGGFSGTLSNHAFALRTNNTDRMTIATDGAITSTLGGMQVRSGTAVSASGTSVDFTSIPSWVKKITVMISSLSTSGTSPVIIQLGTTSGFQTTGYTSAGSTQAGTVVTTTAGLAILTSITAASNSFGNSTINLVGSNVWAQSGLFTLTGSIRMSGGGVTLSDTLTQVRITTVNGTDTFDAGSINILYE